MRNGLAQQAIWKQITACVYLNGVVRLEEKN